MKKFVNSCFKVLRKFKKTKKKLLISKNLQLILFKKNKQLKIIIH